jgi:hypothetical protein
VKLRVAVPVLPTLCVVRSRLLPSCTFPKSTSAVGGIALISDCVPVALSVTVDGLPGALWLIVRVPFCAPAAEGV